MRRGFEGEAGRVQGSNPSDGGNVSGMKTEEFRGPGQRVKRGLLSDDRSVAVPLRGGAGS